MLSRHFTIDNLNTCPMRCPAIRIPLMVYGTVIATTTGVAMFVYLNNNGNDCKLFNTAGYAYSMDIYSNCKALAAACWQLFLNVFPNTIWIGIKAGTYAAAYPGICIYNWLKRQFQTN